MTLPDRREDETMLEYVARVNAERKEVRPPNDRGQGRKPLPEDQRTRPYSVRLTPARSDKLKRLGSEWLAKAIDKAKEKP